ncbi:MAG: DUF4115 domain-containing protein [Candidatus Omnitrophica bacterium]|nr:DUF4115 domain-containing protein [Candidatus Omnitrophota bacterium]
MSDSLGKTLKRIREAKKLSIEEASEKTRISKKILQTIEEDRLNELPSEFYARGFIKTYSRFLNASEEKKIKEYLSGIQQKEKPILILEGEKVPGDWFLKHKKYIGIAVIAIFSMWTILFSVVQVTKFVKNTSAKFKIQMAKRREAKEEQKKKIEQKKKADEEKKKKEAAEKKKAAAKIARPEQSRKDLPAPSSAATATVASSKVSSETTTPVKKENIELEIIAHYNSWVEIISDGELVFRGILKKGTEDIWKAKKEMKLEVGNAGGVELTLNEKKLGTPGKKGEKKEVIITEDGYKISAL